MFFYILSVFMISYFVDGAKIKPANQYFDICHTNDPNFNECATKSVFKATPDLIKGIPELNIMPIEPLFIPEMKMSGNSNKNFKLHIHFKNMKMHGTSNYTMKFMYDMKNDVINFTLTYPKLDFECDYDMDGQILVIPVKGKGPATLNFTEVTTHVNCQMEQYDKGGKTYYRVSKINIKIDPKGCRSYFGNLFNGDKSLGDLTNKAINDNWQAAFDTYRQLPEEAFEEYIKAMSNNVYKLFPKDELFPK